jgi:hypothetical protein
LPTPGKHGAPKIEILDCFRGLENQNPLLYTVGVPTLSQSARKSGTPSVVVILTKSKSYAGWIKPDTGCPLHTQEPVTVASFRTWRDWRECVARDRCLTAVILAFTFIPLRLWW